MNKTNVEMEFLGNIVQVPYSMARYALTWTSLLDAEGNKLESPITRTYDELDTDHIHNIIRHFYKNSSGYSNLSLRKAIRIISLLNEELYYRNTPKEKHEELDAQSEMNKLSFLNNIYKHYG